MISSMCICLQRLSLKSFEDVDFPVGMFTNNNAKTTSFQSVSENNGCSPVLTFLQLKVRFDEDDGAACLNLKAIVSSYCI